MIAIYRQNTIEVRLEKTALIFTPHFQMRLKERLPNLTLTDLINLVNGRRLCLDKVYSIRVRDKAVKIRKVWNDRRKRVELEFITITPLKFSFKGDIKINLNERRL